MLGKDQGWVAGFEVRGSRFGLTFAIAFSSRYCRNAGSGWGRGGCAGQAAGEMGWNFVKHMDACGRGLVSGFGQALGMRAAVRMATLLAWQA